MLVSHLSRDKSEDLGMSHVLSMIKGFCLAKISYPSTTSFHQERTQTSFSHQGVRKCIQLPLNTYHSQSPESTSLKMDSNNWRVKRDSSEIPPTGTPKRSFQPRRSNGFSDSRDSPKNTGSFNQGSSQAGRSPFHKPLNEPAANKAIEEGRRLYVGNLPYDTSIKDIEDLFRDVDGIEAINMSIDPITGRNPSYCFVDLVTKDLAEGVMEMYNGRLFRQRNLKVKPGVKSGKSTYQGIIYSEVYPR